ncbi:MAG: tetratricopeptide repeat protein [Actinobacteria bacterium]|nr:tetratricopeptide repeat protein [Actinomycetota bacterium]
MKAILSREGWRKAGLVVAMLCLAMAFQVGLDHTPAGSGERAGNFPSAASLARFMGGIRQYFAYTFFIKTDKLYHVYGSDAELIPYYRIITYLDPHYEDAYYILSGLIYDAGRREEAMEVNLAGIRANPESADLYFSLADLYLREKRYPEALQAFEKAFSQRPKIIGLLTLSRGLIVLYRKLGREEEARRVYSEMIIRERIELLTGDLDKEGYLETIRRVNADCGELLPEGLGN